MNGDENHLKSVLAAVGPLPVGMRGSLDSFYYYSSGIYDDPNCDGNLDHAVCIVGEYIELKSGILFVLGVCWVNLEETLQNLLPYRI